MNRLAKIASLTLVICFLLLLVAWAARLVYRGYASQRERRVELEATVQVLKRAAHPEWRVRQGTFRISTTDRKDETKWKDLKLVYGTNTVQKFSDVIWKEPGTIVTAWVSDWKPRSEMAKFEQFSVSDIQGNSFTITAQAHTNESIAMEFTVTFFVK
ncbi:MAG: hypothetical protein JWR26_4088 [Pedosphaera sp.]|nr:hypothetical protein [Pedosphaera sp.]